MICIQLPDAAIFFPDDEITAAKPATRRGFPAIAFKARGTGGMQFVKQFQSEKERDKVLQEIAAGQKKEPEEDMTQKLMERIRVTEEELEKMRKSQKQEKSKKTTKKKAKPKKQTKEFVIPTDEEIIAYIKEKKIDQKLGVEADVLAESFRSVCEKEEDTGERDDNGFAIRNIVWRKADGSPVENWKSCLQTFKARQLVWDAKKDKQPKPAVKKNQFTDFTQNEYTDEELEELENSSVD